LHHVFTNGADHGLHFVGVDDSGQVTIGHAGSVELVALFREGLFGGRPEEGVQLLEGTLGPDDESAQLTSGGQLQQVHSGHVAHIHSWHIAEGLHHFDVFIGVDHQRTSSLGEPPVPQFAFAGSQLLALDHSHDVFVDTEPLEEGDGFLGLLDAFETVIDDQRHFGDLFYFVSSGQDQRSAATSGNGGSSSMTSLLDIDLPVPPSPGLDGGEHSTFTAHVTEGTLSTPAGAGSTDSGNSGHSPTGAPRGSRVFHAGLHVHSMSLSGVFVQVVVHELNDVISDGSTEHAGKGYFLLIHF